MKDNSNLDSVGESVEVESIEDSPKLKRLEKSFKLSILKNEVKGPLAGYGKCRSCDCRGYISKHNGSHECKNCNHHFDRHWD